MAEFRMPSMLMPNYVGSALDGYERGHARGQEQRFGTLAKLAKGGQGDVRRNALADMAGINPERAQKFGGALQEEDDDFAQKAVAAAASVVDQYKAGNIEAAKAAYRYALPALQRVAQAHGKDAPPEFDESHLAGLEAMAGVGQSNAAVQSTYVDASGNRVAIMRNGSTRVLGQNDAGMAQQTIEVQGPDGRPMRYTFDKRTGSYAPMGAGQSSVVPEPGMYQTPGGMIRIADDLSPEDRELVMRDVQSGFQSQNEVLPSRDVSRGAIGVGQSPAERAAAEAAARQQVELQYLPERQRIETQGAIDRARGKAQASAGVDVEIEAGKKARDAQATLRLLDKAESLLSGGATGGIVGATKDRALGAFNVSTKGAQATAGLKLIAAELVAKVPRFEGPQSNIDVQFYREAAGDLANDSLPVEQRLAALKTMRELRRQYESGQPDQPRKVNSAADYNALPSGATYIAPDGTQRRKK